MRFVTLVWKNISRRPLRSALTIVGLGVAISAVVSLVGISDSFERHFSSLYSDRGIELIVQRAGSNAELNNTLPEEIGQRIKRLPGVETVYDGLEDLVSFEDRDIFGVIILGLRPGSARLNALDVAEGRRLEAGDSKSLMAGETAARNLGVHVGDKLPLYGDHYEVVGIYRSNNVFDRGCIVTLLKDLQDAMNRPQQVTGFAVSTSIPHDGSPEHVAEMTRLRRQIESLEHGISASPMQEFISNVGAIKLSHTMAWAVSAIALSIAALGMLNTMIMSVYERIHDIGTLRALGWRKLQVVRMILVEAVLLSLAGGLTGSVAALLMTRFLSRFPTVAGFIAGDIAPPVIFEGIFVAFVVGVVGSLYPAYWGASLSPVEAMRRK